MRRRIISWVSLIAAACGVERAPDVPAPSVVAELTRVTEGVEIRADGFEARFELIANGSKIAARAARDDGFTFEASASIGQALRGEATARFGEETAAIEAGGGVVRFVGRTYETVIELRGALSGTIYARAFEVLGPYHQGVTARLPEAEPIYRLIALGVAPPVVWPALGDPRDEQPPGMIAGDTPGLGMTCSPEIRCPNAAPFCVTETHDSAFGFCTSACVSDGDCATARGIGLCALPVWDIPGVSVPVQSCVIGCDVDRACPAMLGCGVAFGTMDRCTPDPRAR